MESHNIIGKLFYRFHVVDDECVLLSYPILLKLSSSQSDKEIFSSEDVNKDHRRIIRYMSTDKFYVTSGFEETEVFTNVRDATQNIWDRYILETQKGNNISLYLKKIIKSEIFQDVLEKNPSVMI